MVVPYNFHLRFDLGEFGELIRQFFPGKQHKTYGLRWLVTYNVNPQHKYEAGKLKGVPLSETDTVKAVFVGAGGWITP